jgi:hypothetical protein
MGEVRLLEVTILLVSWETLNMITIHNFNSNQHSRDKEDNGAIHLKWLNQRVQLVTVEEEI